MGVKGLSWSIVRYVGQIESLGSLWEGEHQPTDILLWMLQ